MKYKLAAVCLALSLAVTAVGPGAGAAPAEETAQTEIAAIEIRDETAVTADASAADDEAAEDTTGTNAADVAEAEAETEAQTENGANADEDGLVSAESRQEAVDAGSQGAATVAASTPLSVEEADVSAEDAVNGARELLARMRELAESGDAAGFAALCEASSDTETVEAQMAAAAASAEAAEDLTGRSDICIAQPDGASEAAAYTVALTDYDVDDDGAVAWYSTILRIVRYESGWKLSTEPAPEAVRALYPAAFTEAEEAGRPAMDLYPYLAMRFYEQATFADAFYALVTMVWENEDGSLGVALWLSNDEFGDKWCDDLELTLTDAALGVLCETDCPVQQTIPAGSARLLILTVDAEDVRQTGEAYTAISVQSNLNYQ